MVKERKEGAEKHLIFICAAGRGGGLYWRGILINQAHNASQIWK